MANKYMNEYSTTLYILGHEEASDKPKWEGILQNNLPIMSKC